MFIPKAVWLENPTDIEKYRAKINSLLGIDFPLSYFMQGKVRAFLNEREEIIGGYVLIMKAPFRTLSSVPAHIEMNHIDQDSLIEVTGMFLDRSIKSGLASCKFWLMFSRDLSAQKNKTHYVYAYDLKKIKLQELYALAKPLVIYRGMTKKLEGMKSTGLESIEIAQCKTIGLLPFYGLPSFLCKLFFSRKTYFRYLFKRA